MPAQKLNRAIKYRAFPTNEQAELFAKTFGCVRLVWNNMLADAQRFYDETGELFITTPAKYKKRFPFLKEVDSIGVMQLSVGPERCIPQSLLRTWCWVSKF